MIKRRICRSERRHCFGKTSAHIATDTPICERNRVPAVLHYQRLIDIDLPEVINDSGDPKPLCLVKDRVEEGGLARAEKSTDHRDRNARRRRDGGHCHADSPAGLT